MELLAPVLGSQFAAAAETVLPSSSGNSHSWLGLAGLSRAATLATQGYSHHFDRALAALAPHLNLMGWCAPAWLVSSCDTVARAVLTVITYGSDLWVLLVLLVMVAQVLWFRVLLRKVAEQQQHNTVLEQQSFKLLRRVYRTQHDARTASAALDAAATIAYMSPVAIERGALARLADNPSMSIHIQPLLHLMQSEAVRQALEEKCVAEVAARLPDRTATAISLINGVNYDDNPLVEPQQSALGNYNTEAKMAARKSSIAMALVLLHHMNAGQAAVVVKLLAADGPLVRPASQDGLSINRSSFAASCVRMFENQMCALILDSVVGESFGVAYAHTNHTVAVINAAFLMVSLLLQNVL